MKIYLITYVASDGFFDGTESMPIVGADPKQVIDKAYGLYVSDWKEGRAALEDENAEMLSLEEFAAVMESGFGTNSKVRDNYVMTQFRDSHTQFEPMAVDIGYNIIDRNSFIASKLWSREDVLSVLNERGYEGTEAEIDAVINTDYLKALDECTDRDWSIINDAITEATRTGTI